MGLLLRSVLIAIIAAVTCVCGTAQTHNTPFVLAINTDTPTVKSGSAVSINILMTNTSGHDVSCTKAYTKNGVNMSYRYDVIGPSGKPAGERARKHPELEAGSIYPCTLGPGKSSVIASTSIISALFDMSKPGKYSVQVSRRVEGAAPIRSNKIQITVTP